MRRQNSRGLIALRQIVMPLACAIGISIVAAAGVLAADPIPGDEAATLRKTAIKGEQTAPAMMPVTEKPGGRVRNYPDQPPTIPHQIRGYQIDLNSNKCLSCHSRRATEDSKAPMVSVTHFMDRDGQTRAAVTSRRYFCTQCHVPQHEVKPLVENTFVDVDAMLKKEK